MRSHCEGRPAPSAVYSRDGWRIEYVKRDGREVFLASTLHQDAVLRDLHTMTEAARRLTLELKSKHSEIDGATCRPFALFSSTFTWRRHRVGLDRGDAGSPRLQEQGRSDSQRSRRASLWFNKRFHLTSAPVTRLAFAAHALCRMSRPPPQLNKSFGGPLR